MLKMWTLLNKIDLWTVFVLFLSTAIAHPKGVTMAISLEERGLCSWSITLPFSVEWHTGP